MQNEARILPGGCAVIKTKFEMADNCSQVDYPVGIQSFEKIRREGLLYVDKTRYIHQIVRKTGYYFLSRPRRFGKSLLVSTLEAYFRGRRDLFKGLAIDSLTEEWEGYPVLHLDLNSREYKEYDDLLKELNQHLERWEKLYGDEKKGRNVEERFAYVIEQAYRATGKPVVILVDEYDKPMLNAIENEELFEAFKSTLKAFYSNLKTMDRYIKFGFLTGVARFSRVSIFSDLNNLNDISFNESLSAICGITGDEINEYFQCGLSSIAGKYGWSVEKTKEELKRNYDGYHFCANCPDLYNPFSLLNAFYNGEIRNYWAATGTPTYLTNLLKNEDWDLQKLEGCEIGRDSLQDAGIPNPDKPIIVYGNRPLTRTQVSESYFQNVIYILFTLMGYHTQAEERTSDGRINITIQTKDYVYIMEIKVDGTPQEAMAQILEKEYWRKFEASGKRIFLIGVAFSTESRHLTGHEILEH